MHVPKLKDSYFDGRNSPAIFRTAFSMKHSDMTDFGDMVTCTPPPDGLRHGHPMHIHTSSPSRLSSALPLSPMRVAPAPALLDKSTSASMQKIFSTKSGMSPSVYDARPAYHHQDTSPKTVPAIKIGNHIAPPLSPIRAVQDSPATQQNESPKKAAIQGESSQPLSPTSLSQIKTDDLSSPQAKSPSHWEGSFCYKTSPQKKILTSFQDIDVFASQCVPAIANSTNPVVRIEEPPHAHAEVPCLQDPKETSPRSTSAQSEQPHDARVRALSPSPTRTRTYEVTNPERGDSSFASLRLQDENSQSQWDDRPVEEACPSQEQILEHILQPSHSSSASSEGHSTAHDKIFSRISKMPAHLLPKAASLSKSTSCLSPQEAFSTPTSDNLARSVNRLSPSRRANRRNSSVHIEQLFEQDKDRFKKLTGRPTNFHIRTSDRYSIPVHKENLMVFTNLLDEHARTRKAIDVPEPYIAWHYMLPYCYPTMEAGALAEASNEWSVLLQTLVLAEKYSMLANRGMERLVTMAYTYLENLAREENPRILRIYDYPDSEKIQQWQRKHWKLAAKLFKHAGALDASIPASALKAFLVRVATVSSDRFFCWQKDARFEPLRLSER
ncbi:hypothetical protein P389DRAFT_190989 [Cystobasidium minutum MCA 4210]|uniref:uncharacterized protein n=1 Tax=Cystobasidium minutum MCA 4210 TaxID=1397322 RepID=UPI0034CFB769|eukprot:jgi/Rhomi1/190989/estExt_fgenesh1_pg.C_60307